DVDLCYGATGRLLRIQNGVTEPLVTGLPSIASPQDGTEATGPHDIAFDATGQAYVLVGLGSNPGNRDQLPTSDFAQLLAINDLNGEPSWTAIADLAAYEAANNPDGGDPATGGIDTNPYSLLIEDSTAYVVDAGANALLSVGLNDEEIATESVFSDRLVTNPFSGATIPMESVPTSITVGPDDAFYMGELTGFPYPEGGARVFRLNSENQPEVYAEGFTNIIDLEFDPEGNLFVLEYATNSILSGDPTGALIRVAPDGTRTTLLDQELRFPTALAVGSDNSIYVSNNGFVGGQGEILRVDLTDETSVPESTSIVGLLAIGSVGVVTQLRRKQKSATVIKK
ncbi:MAG: ScyD/ScyE family protein, partial [Coleofasciculus sp. C2-GNP5-27]